MRPEFALFALVLAQAGLAQAQTPPAPEPVEIAAQIHEIPSLRIPDRGPDGNTIILDAPGGLIVVDTGRHVWQSDAILAFARAQNRPIVAIINTHWHLDHSSGNRRIKAAFPNAPLYTSNAVDRALTTFLARNLDRARAREAAGEGEAIEREERQLFIDTMAHADALKPDIPLTRSRRMDIAGRSLDVHVSDHAVSDADVWLYERRARVAFLGDLVTLPAPFFETACPRKWSEELDRVWATPFRLAIPGHGAVMSRAQFDTYRTAFNAFLDCVGSNAVEAQCAAGWAEGIASLEPDDAALHTDASIYAAYYVGFLRDNGGASPDCIAR